MNIVSMMTFYWLGDFLKNSLGKTLELKDLLKPSSKRSVQFTSTHFTKIMTKQKTVNLKAGLQELLLWEYLKSVLPKFISDILNLSHPYTLFQIIHFLETGNKDLAITWTFVLFCTKSVAILCDTRHRYMISKLADIVRDHILIHFRQRVDYPL